MVTVVTRSANGIPLTHQQVDDNFTGLADAVNNVGGDILAEATAAKNSAVIAASAAQTSSISAANSANAASLSQGSAATSAEHAAASAASIPILSAPDGASKVGFGDKTVAETLTNIQNAFYEGGGNLTPIAVFSDVPVVGGDSGPLNVQAQALLNRTAFLAGITSIPIVARNYNDLIDILDTISGDIAIQVPYGRFRTPPPEKMRAGVRIFGDVVPSYSYSGDRLVCGSILEGKYEAKLLNNVGLYNIGVDCGDYVTANVFGGNLSDAIVMTNWDGVAGHVFDYLSGCRIGNVIGLIPTNKPGSPVPFHGVLIEGLGQGCSIGDIDGCGGIASVVVKCADITTGVLSGLKGDPYTVVVKSNDYAKCNNMSIPIILSRDGGGVAFVSDDETIGYQLSRIWVGSIDTKNCQYGVRTDSASGRPVSDITIGHITAQGIPGIGLAIKGSNTSRISVGSHYFEGCGIGALVTDGATDCSIGDGFAIGSAGYGYQIDVAGTRAGNIFASNTVGGQGIVTNTADFIALSASGRDNANGNFGGSFVPLTVSASDLIGVAGASGVTVEDTLQISCSDKYKVSFVRGVVNAAPIVNGTLLCTLPAQFRPLVDKFVSVVAFAGDAFSIQPISISGTDGTVTYRGTSATIVYFSGGTFDRR